MIFERRQNFLEKAIDNATRLCIAPPEDLNLHVIQLCQKLKA